MSIDEIVSELKDDEQPVEVAGDEDDSNDEDNESIT